MCYNVDVFCCIVVAHILWFLCDIVKNKHGTGEKIFWRRKKRVVAFWLPKQGCQLPDFSLRSETFCCTADFSTTFFYICLKPRLFCKSHYKTTSKHPRIQDFWLYFAKKFCNFRQKQEKCPYPVGSFCAWAGLWPAITHTLSTFRSFQTFWKHNVSNTVCLAQMYLSGRLPRRYCHNFRCL